MIMPVSVRHPQKKKRANTNLMVRAFLIYGEAGILRILICFAIPLISNINLPM